MNEMHAAFEPEERTFKLDPEKWNLAEKEDTPDPKIIAPNTSIGYEIQK